jgi:tetratricopeptide (TPR) repeat protein
LPSTFWSWFFIYSPLLGALAAWFKVLFRGLVVLAGAAEKPGRVWLCYGLAVLLYAGLVSPFYMAIKPGSFGEAVVLDIPKAKPWTPETHEEMVAREYFLSGKDQAALGTMSGYVKSLDYYNRALELAPGLATIHAEIAISYASIGRINNLAWRRLDSARHYFDMSRERLTEARTIDSMNPTVWAAGALLAQYAGRGKEAKGYMRRMLEAAKVKGSSDRVLQVRAFVARNPTNRVLFLRAVEDSFPEYAEMQNLLGLAYYQCNMPDSARRRFAKAQLLSSDNVEVQLNQVLLAPGSLGEAGRVRLYVQAASTGSEWRRLALHFGRVLRWQCWLRAIVVLLLVMYGAAGFGRLLGNEQWFSLPFSVSLYLNCIPQLRQLFWRELQRVDKPETILVVWTVPIYLAFEFVVRIANPVNSFSHMFPTSFPFF